MSPGGGTRQFLRHLWCMMMTSASYSSTSFGDS